MRDSNFCLLFKGSCLKQKIQHLFLLTKYIFFTVYELDIWLPDLNSDFKLKDCLFGGVKFAKNAYLNKYVYSGYGIWFDLLSEISLPDGSMSENIIIVGVDINSSVHIDNQKNYLNSLYRSNKRVRRYYVKNRSYVFN